MHEARKAFEAMLKTKGKDSGVWANERYVSKNIQTYWRWFLLGWTFRGAKL